MYEPFMNVTIFSRYAQQRQAHSRADSKLFGDDYENRFFPLKGMFIII